MQVNITTKHRDTVTVNPNLKVIDWRNSSDRKWLMNHLHWAMNNSSIVVLSPEAN